MRLSSSQTESSETYDFPCSFYGRSNHLMAFGNQGIAVGQDGSKRVVQLVPQSSVSSSYISVEDQIFSRFPPGRRLLGDNKDSSGGQSVDPTAAGLAAGRSIEQESNKSFDNEAYFISRYHYADQKSRNLYSKRSRLATPTPSTRSWSLFEQENLSTLRNNLTVILSAIYAVFLVTLGVVIGVADLIVPETNLGEVFSMYLLVLGLAWYIFLHLDLLRHNRNIKKHEMHLRTENHHLKEGPLFGRCKLTERRSKPKCGASLKHHAMSPDYMFNRGRHSGSFFLKIGAAGFCFGHLIHSCLMLARQILHWTSSDPAVRQKCAHRITLALYLLIPVYSFYQLYILFKYSNVIINRLKELARFALMHSLATSLFFWFSMILRETVDSLHHQMIQDRQNHTHHTVTNGSHAHWMPMLMNLTGDTKEYTALMGLWNGAVSNWDHCAGGSDFSALILHVSPYLYPFSIEYSILVVGIWFIMWSNVGQIEKHVEFEEHTSCSSFALRPTNLRNDLIIHANCHSANRGLFAGLLVLVATVVSIIIFFLAFSNDEYVSTGILINLASECTLLILMIIAVVFAYRQLSHLSINKNAVSLLDDLLLFMCIPCFFLYGIFSIVPAMAYSNYVAITVIILQVVQVILQTPFIIDGLRRCSNSLELQESKPGRELVTFLIVCNIAMWIIETFEIKSYETNSDRIHFYGYPLWAFLSHVTLPLTLFYRFHSSACLVDIWKSAYENGE